MTIKVVFSDINQDNTQYTHKQQINVSQTPITIHNFRKHLFSNRHNIVGNPFQENLFATHENDGVSDRLLWEPDHNYVFDYHINEDEIASNVQYSDGKIEDNTGASDVGWSVWSTSAQTDYKNSSDLCGFLGSFALTGLLQISNIILILFLLSIKIFITL